MTTLSGLHLDKLELVTIVLCISFIYKYLFSSACPALSGIEEILVLKVCLF